MSVRIAYDPVDDIAVMYDSASGSAFGPIFNNDGGTKRCQAFIDSLPLGPLAYGDMELRILRNEWALDNPRGREEEEEDDGA